MDNTADLVRRAGRIAPPQPDRRPGSPEENGGTGRARALAWRAGGVRAPPPEGRTDSMSEPSDIVHGGSEADVQEQRMAVDADATRKIGRAHV